MLRGKTQKELIQLSKTLIQPLLPSYYKGQNGKIAVIGGCEDYTGAPYFAASASALLGSDLSHVVCEKQAAPVIKSYSPDLMVHPYLFDLENPDTSKFLKSEVWDQLKGLDLKDIIKPDFKAFDDIIESKILPKVLGIVNRCDIFVIGPGFGRDFLMVKTMVRIIEEIKVANKPFILDADALFLVSLNPSIVKNYPKAVLTPNLIEFERIGNALGLPSILKESNFDKVLDVTTKLSKKLGGITIVRKADVELIVEGDLYLHNSIRGSNRRVGGQGDTLTGALATFINWAYHYQDGYWEIEGPKLSDKESRILACYAAASVVRVASNKAFKRLGRSLQASTIQKLLGESYSELFEGEDFVKL